MFDLQTFWFLMLGVLLTAYAILDGFDLGVGVVHWTARDRAERAQFIRSIGPLWDGNEVCLVAFGGAFFGAFPIAYAASFSGFYLPFMALLLGLLLRAVAIEFRDLEKANWWRNVWDIVLCCACIQTCMVFGVMIGNALRGMPIEASREFTGTLSDLGGLFPLLVGLQSVVLFGLHGTLYLRMRLAGEVKKRLTRTAWILLGIYVAMRGVLAVYTWENLPKDWVHLLHHHLTWTAGILNCLALAGIAVGLWQGRLVLAFLCSAANILTLNCMLAGMLYPRILVSSLNPDWSLTIYNSCSSLGTMGYMRWVALLGTPLALGYFAISYWVFRGQVPREEADS